MPRPPERRLCVLDFYSFAFIAVFVSSSLVVATDEIKSSFRHVVARPRPSLSSFSWMLLSCFVSLPPCLVSALRVSPSGCLDKGYHSIHNGRAHCLFLLIESLVVLQPCIQLLLTFLCFLLNSWRHTGRKVFRDAKFPMMGKRIGPFQFPKRSLILMINVQITNTTKEYNTLSKK